MSRTRAGGRAGGGPELAVADAADEHVARPAPGASADDAPTVERATRTSADSPTSASEGAPAGAPVRAPAALDASSASDGDAHDGDGAFLQAAQAKRREVVHILVVFGAVLEDEDRRRARVRGPHACTQPVATLCRSGS